MHRPLLLAAALVGCAAPSEALVARLDACGLLSEGEFGPRALAGLYAPTDCYEDCLGAASCEALEAAVCRSDVSLLRACDERCAHRCGDGALIGVERICDAVANCADASDEIDCPGWTVLTCRDGSRAMGRRCDVVYQCPDGSDEDGCARTSCSDRFLPPYWRCNGNPECSDGSDEAWCGTYRCEDGRSVIYRPEGPTPRCDGVWQCSDGSDERGCAELQRCCGC
jgi:hypothetical protein